MVGLFAQDFVWMGKPEVEGALTSGPTSNRADSRPVSPSDPNYSPGGEGVAVTPKDTHAAPWAAQEATTHTVWTRTIWRLVPTTQKRTDPLPTAADWLACVLVPTTGTTVS